MNRKKINLPNISAEMTVEQWLIYWFEAYAKRTIKQSTAISYRGYINNHIVPQIGSYRLSELNISLLQDFFNERYDNGKSGGGQLSPKTLHNIRLMLHRALQKAVDLELLRKNFAESVELPKQTAPQLHVLTVMEQKRLIAELHRSDEKLAFGVYLSLTTGMRLGEVLGLRWSDVDTETNLIHICRTVNRLQTLDGKTKTELVVGTPKSLKSIREIPFNERLKEEFALYRRKSVEWLGKKPKNNDYIFSLQYGKPVEPKTLQTAFKRILEAAGIKAVNFHTLRHTFATRAVESKADVKTLSVLLGHADVGTTLNRYVHILDEQKRKTMSLILDDMLDSSQSASV